MSDKLTIEEIDSFISIYKGYKNIKVDVYKQLADTLRENERLRGALEQISEHQKYGSTYGSGIRYAHCAMIAKKVLQQYKQSLPSYMDVCGILANCQICKTTPCVCEIQPKTSGEKG